MAASSHFNFCQNAKCYNSHLLLPFLFHKDEYQDGNINVWHNKFLHHHSPGTDLSPYSTGSNWQQLLKQHLTTKLVLQLTVCVCVSAQHNNHKRIPVKAKLMPFNVIHNLHILGNNYSKSYFNIIPEHLYLLCCHHWNFILHFLAVSVIHLYSAHDIVCPSLCHTTSRMHADTCYGNCYTLH
jgi:hypothetical protein